jgi:flagellar basal-body rod modification protein FlgD
MAVDAVNSAAAAAAAAAATQSASNAAKAATVDYDAFLKLLVAQLKNQDPTNPTDSAEFMAQLASFSNVEQGIKMNTKLDGMITSLALTQADGLIGKTVISSDGKISGVVDSVRIVSGGAVAVLTNGKELPLEAGITVKANEPS